MAYTIKPLEWKEYRRYGMAWAGAATVLGTYEVYGEGDTTWWIFYREEGDDNAASGSAATKVAGIEAAEKHYHSQVLTLLSEA